MHNSGPEEITFNHRELDCVTQSGSYCELSSAAILQLL